MTDIAKCLNQECPMKHKCYRWTAPSDKYGQLYADFKPDETGKCDNLYER